MRKIVLLRHAKSSWDDYSLRDHDRPLGPRGWRDMPIMANRLKTKSIIPDLILCSTALRAKQTAEVILKEIGLPESLLSLTETLYHASAITILDEIKKQPNHVETLFVVGHNPGFNDLIELLGGSIPNLPTSGQYGFKANINSWQELSTENAETWFVDFPKKSN
jgi:phosphohistidine phosphatase